MIGCQPMLGRDEAVTHLKVSLVQACGLNKTKNLKINAKERVDTASVDHFDRCCAIRNWVQVGELHLVRTFSMTLERRTAIF